MATGNRPVPAKLSRTDQPVVEFYAHAKHVPEVEELLGPVMRGEIRSDAVLSRIRKAAQIVAEDWEIYPTKAVGSAVQILRRVGRSSKGGAEVQSDGGRKAPRATLYAEDEAQMEHWKRAAALRGLSLNRWIQIELDKAADAARGRGK